MALAACHNPSAADGAHEGQARAPDPNSLEASAKPIPVHAFEEKFIPPAQGSGNFEVCLGREAKEDGIARVTVPAAAIFKSWGQVTGDLRDPSSFDMNTVAGKDWPGMGYAVVLVRPVTLTAAELCRITEARAVTHQGMGLLHENVPLELHLSFQADGLTETAGGDIENEQPADEALRDAFGSGQINGSPVRDVAGVRRLRDASN